MRSDHWRNEAEFVPRNLEELHELRYRIMATGHSVQVANGVGCWLLDKDKGIDCTSSKTRSMYRKVLAELEPPVRAPEPDDRCDRLRPVRDGEAPAAASRERGSIAGRAVAAVALAGLAAVGIGASGTQKAHAAVPQLPAPAPAGAPGDEPGSLDRTGRSRRKAA